MNITKKSAPPMGALGRVATGNEWTPRLRELETYARVMVENTTGNSDSSMALVLVDKKTSPPFAYQRALEQEGEEVDDGKGGFVFLVADADRFREVTKAIGGTPDDSFEHVQVLLCADGLCLGTSIANPNASAPHPRTEVRRSPDGSFECNPLAALILYYRSAPSDVKEGAPRDRLQRFQERVRGLVSAEAIRSNPRTVEQLIDDTFGRRFEADWRRVGFERAFDAFFALLDASPS